MVMDYHQEKEIIVVSRERRIGDHQGKGDHPCNGLQRAPEMRLKYPRLPARPGIYTAGTAQRLMNIEGHMVGKEVVTSAPGISG